MQCARCVGRQAEQINGHTTIHSSRREGGAGGVEDKGEERGGLGDDVDNADDDPHDDNNDNDSGGDGGNYGTKEKGLARSSISFSSETEV